MFLLIVAVRYELWVCRLWWMTEAGRQGSSADYFESVCTVMPL